MKVKNDKKLNRRPTLVQNQSLEHLPFGETLVEEHLDSYNSPFKFNAKELDAETGNYYYGARYYDPKWSLFISTDPAFELYPSFSSYAYTLQNPVKYIDPTGMFVEDYDDDYFNKQGKYLGSDNAKTDKVRIIEQDVWDRNKIIDEQGRESINHNIGYENSSAFSESNLTIEEELKVYQHYNPTDLTLEADTESRHGGATFIARLFNDGSTSENININIKGNKRNSKIADDANAIINVFEHERYHYDIYKKEGFSKYLETPKNVRERRAVMAQMKHPSFSKTSINFQRSIINYGKRHGLQMTVNELVPVKIKGL